MFKLANLFFSLTILALANAGRGGGGRGGGGGGGRGGGGGGGRSRKGRGGGMLGMVEKPEFISSGCNSVDPTCSYNRKGDEGVWVCRTIYSPWTGEETSTFSACIDPEMGLSVDGQLVDVCGCCDDNTCPTQCTCECETSDGSAGFQVMPAAEDASGSERCVPPQNALAMIAGDRFTCGTGCIE
jgi:hypothetical protein